MTSTDELVRLIEELSPMRRLFIKQQIREKHSGAPNIFDGGYTVDEVREIYREWRDGFDQGVIDKIESGEWCV